MSRIMLQANTVVNRRDFSYLCYQMPNLQDQFQALAGPETYVVLGLAIYEAYVILARRY